MKSDNQMIGLLFRALTILPNVNDVHFAKHADEFLDSRSRGKTSESTSVANSRLFRCLPRSRAKMEQIYLIELVSGSSKQSLWEII